MTSRSTALKHLKQVDPHFYAATQAHHSALPVELPHKATRAQLFEALASIVTSQQLGTAAAASIFKRVKRACGGRLTPDSLCATTDADLRAAGLSGSKVKTLRALASAVQQREIDLLALKNLPEDEAAEMIKRIWGLGSWSAEMFLIFALGRRDVFSPGDLGLARAVEALYSLPKGSSREELLEISQKWSPHRTFASLLLWKFRDARN